MDNEEKTMTDEKAETPIYTFVTKPDEVGMGRIVVAGERHGKSHPRYFGIPVAVAIDLERSINAELRRDRG